MEASCLDSYASTITRLGNGQLDDEKKVMFLGISLFRSQRHIIEIYAEGQATFHHKLPVHGIRYDYNPALSDIISNPSHLSDRYPIS